MNDSDTANRIADNWRTVCRQVLEAEAAAGRVPSSTKIVGVSKYVDVTQTRMLVEAGCRILGESRPQSLWTKAESGQIPDDVQWHLIGHLQRNKVRRLLKHPVLIESIDSRRVLEAVAEESMLQRQITRVMLEVNISGDQNKTGLSPEEIPSILQTLPTEGVEVLGLMAMAGWGTDPKEARKQFALARRLRDELREKFGLPLPELSMGMSGDFPEAIAEGATMVRIGSRLFEGVRSP